MFSAMSMSWQHTLIGRLFDGANSDGAWGYHPGGTAFTEPTSLASLALVVHGAAPQRRRTGLDWMAEVQQENGSLPLSPDLSSPCWPTGLAILAWLGADADRRPRYEGNVQKAGSWLLNIRGRPAPHAPDVLGHDTSLQGWPWVADTHSWVEPTAYAVAALRAVGKAEHPHVREGVRLLLDRTIPEGGWNYGNKRVLRNTLRPFPATTGIALAALAGEPPDSRIEASIGYLIEELGHVRSPQSLAWGLIGLTAWKARPASSPDWLAEAADQATRREPNIPEEALLLLAGAEWHPPQNARDDVF